MTTPSATEMYPMWRDAYGRTGHYGEFMAVVDAATNWHNNAIYWYHRCAHLEEIIELMCLDAESQQERHVRGEK